MLRRFYVNAVAVFIIKTALVAWMLEDIEVFWAVGDMRTSGLPVAISGEGWGVAPIGNRTPPLQSFSCPNAKTLNSTGDLTKRTRTKTSAPTRHTLSAWFQLIIYFLSPTCVRACVCVFSLGRKVAWYMSLVLMICSGSSAAFMPNYWLFVTFRLLLGAASTGVFTCGFVISKFLCRKMRDVASSVACTSILGCFSCCLL